MYLVPGNWEEVLPTTPNVKECPLGDAGVSVLSSYSFSQGRSQQRTKQEIKQRPHGDAPTDLLEHPHIPMPDNRTSCQKRSVTYSTRKPEIMRIFSVRVRWTPFLITALGYKTTPHRINMPPQHDMRYTTHRALHDRMLGEREGGKAYYSGGQEKEWLGRLKSHSQQHKPNDTTHHTPHTTHNAPHTHNLMCGKREGGKGYHSGGAQESSAYVDSFCDYFDYVVPGIFSSSTGRSREYRAWVYSRAVVPQSTPQQQQHGSTFGTPYQVSTALLVVSTINSTVPGYTPQQSTARTTAEQ